MLTTVNAQMINMGASVKSFPTLNPIDTILTASATPTPLIAPVIPINQNNVPIAATPAIVPNIMQIDNTPNAQAPTPAPAPGAAPASDNNVIILAGLGLGALLLFSGKNKEVTGIGKKKSSLLPLVLVAGAGLWYWYTQKQSAAVVTPVLPVTPAPLTTLPATVPTSPAPPPLITPPAVAALARGVTAANDVSALQRDWPALNGIYPLLTDSEVITLYNYFYGYVLPGLKLYRDPGATGIYSDGNYNTALYNAVAAIRVKYNVNI